MDIKNFEEKLNGFIRGGAVVIRRTGTYEGKPWYQARVVAGDLMVYMGWTDPQELEMMVNGQPRKVPLTSVVALWKERKDGVWYRGEKIENERDLTIALCQIMDAQQVQAKRTQECAWPGSETAEEMQPEGVKELKELVESFATQATRSEVELEKAKSEVRKQALENQRLRDENARLSRWRADLQAELEQQRRTITLAEHQSLRHGDLRPFEAVIRCSGNRMKMLKGREPFTGYLVKIDGRWMQVGD